MRLCYLRHFLTVKVNILSTVVRGGPASSVGVATDYGLDGPGSNPGGDEIFRVRQTGPGASCT